MGNLWKFHGNLGKIQGKSRKNLSKWVIQQSRSNIFAVTPVTPVTV